MCKRGLAALLLMLLIGAWGCSNKPDPHIEGTYPTLPVQKPGGVPPGKSNLGAPKPQVE